MQTILGAGGIIGRELAQVLPQYTNSIRLVARNPKAVVGNEELVSADLLNREATIKAVEGSEVVYLCVGLEYNIKVWQASWPRIMDNIIVACAEHKAKLVFFDNIYMYHPLVTPNITEAASKDPQSEKGKVRAAILAKLWRAHEDGKIQATVARAADFYGPNAGAVSVLNEGALKPLLAGKPANWFGSKKVPHSFTYTKDAAKATAILGNSDKAWGEEWHLPTSKEELTGEDFVQQLAALTGKKAKIQVANAFLLRIMGLFIPVMREFPEMLYQYKQPYRFNSDKFEKAFGMKPTTYREGLLATVQAEE